MASLQYGFDHQGMEIVNDELTIMSFLEEESPLENHVSVNEEEEEKLNRVIRSLEVEINMPPIDSRKTDLQHTKSGLESRKMDLQHTKSGLEDDFAWLNDFDDIGVISTQNGGDEMMNWCRELTYMDGVDSSSVLEIEGVLGGDYYSHINYGLEFDEQTYSLWQDNNDVIMY